MHHSDLDSSRSIAAVASSDIEDDGLPSGLAHLLVKNLMFWGSCAVSVGFAAYVLTRLFAG